MNATSPGVLTINGGSSSIKFAVYRADDPLARILHGKIERIGTGDARLSFHDAASDQRDVHPIDAPDNRAAVAALFDWLEIQAAFGSVQAVGHRVVHGMTHTEPERITPELLDELRRIEAVDPDHLPGEIALIEAVGQRHPNLPQVACFDTAFHREMPRVAKLLPIPRRYDARGVQRYGFHGLSYAYLMQELARIAGQPAAQARVILAHLGGGASMTAVREGRSVDTTMGFTPAAGLVMGTRAGDLDPGLAPYLARTENMTPDGFDRMVNHEAGLLGVSETSADLRDLLAKETEDTRAAEAVALFCYQAKKWLGAYAAVLGGVDTLVFAGGIGENSPVARARICAGLEFLGLALDEARNTADAAVISADASRVTVRVIRTDEELMIARSVCRILGLGAASKE